MQKSINSCGTGSIFAAFTFIVLSLAIIGVVAGEMLLLNHTEKEIKIIQTQSQSISKPALIAATTSTYNTYPLSTTLADIYCQFRKGSPERNRITKELQKRIYAVARKSGKSAFLRIWDCTKNNICFNVQTFGKKPKVSGKMATLIIPTAEATMAHSCIEHTKYIKIELLLQE